MFGQGRVFFNNVSGPADATVAVTVTNNAAAAHAGEGAAGAFVGSDYSIMLLWAPQGSYASEAAFLAAVVGSGGTTGFFGTTGGSPTTDGAGLFDAGTVPNPVGTSMPAGTYTMQAEAWYNGGTFSTFNLAFAAGVNTGYSQMFNLAATAFPTSPNNTVFPAFAVGTVPEPGTFALAGLGAAVLMMFRRRK